jgi:transposase InsO family protein
MSNIHPQARTTPLIRSEIQASSLSTADLVKLYNSSKSTIAKWRQRTETSDHSHCPNNLQTTLSKEQELIVVELRRALLLPLDDMLVVTREFIHPKASRAGIHRCLVRHNVNNLKDLIPKDEGDKQPVKTFKDYEPGFIHIDIKYLPKMPDEDSRRYLFVAIDRATRWVFIVIYQDQTKESSVDFLRKVEMAAPMKIKKLLTDNGTQFTDRFTSNKKDTDGKSIPTGQHDFDQACNALKIEHRLIPPRHPQTNGMVERFNGRISEIVQQTRFASAAELDATLNNYAQVYNYHIPQKALGHIAPIQALKKWQTMKPELFKILDNDQMRPDK